MAIQSIDNSTFIQLIIKINIKNIPAPHHCDNVWKPTSNWWITLAKGQYCGKCFHVSIISCLIYLVPHKIVMTWPCIIQSSIWHLSFSLASNHFGYTCEQIWKEQCHMTAYIKINKTKWYCSKICIKVVIRMTKLYLPSLCLLTLKWLGLFFQNVISFSDAVHLMCYSFIWN